MRSCRHTCNGINRREHRERGSGLTEIETAIPRLSAEERAKRARWWQATFDPDEGLELREEVAQELDAAQREIERHEVANWQQLKQAAKTTAR